MNIVLLIIAYVFFIATLYALALYGIKKWDDNTDDEL